MTSTIAAAARDQRRRRMLLPMATLLAAASIAGISGANFNASTTNVLSAVETGSFGMTNSRPGAAIFNAANLKPGDVVKGSVVITNNSSLPATLDVVETDGDNEFTEGLLTMQIVETKVVGDVTTTKTIHNGNFGAFETDDLGLWAAQEERTYTFTVELLESATVDEQSKKAEAAYEWSSVQTAGEMFDQRES